MKIERIIILCILVFVIVVLFIGFMLKDIRVDELIRENKKLKDFSVKKSAMMLSYVKGWNDGHTRWLSYGYIPIEITKESQAIKFLEDKGILDASTSNYMIKILESVK